MLNTPLSVEFFTRLRPTAQPKTAISCSKMGWTGDRFQGSKSICNVFGMAFIVILTFVLYGCGRNGEFSIPERQEGTPYCCDYSGFLGSDKESLSIFFEEFLKESNIEFVVAVTPSLGEETINRLAVKFFRKWEIGQNNQGRGILLLIAVAEKMIRFEISYDLEHIFTDGFCGYIATNQLKPYLKQGFFGMALQDIAFLLVERINISKDLHAEKIFKNFEQSEFKSTLLYGSGGAGVKKEIELGTGWEQKQSLSENQKKLFLAQNTPYGTLMVYKKALNYVITDPLLDIYTEATQMFYEYWPINCLDSVRDLLSLTEGHPIDIEISGRFAVAKPSRNYKYGHPFFLVKGKDNLWRMDNVRLWRNCFFTSEAEYVVSKKDHPYIFAYGAQLTQIGLEQQKAWCEEQRSLRSEIMSLKKKIADKPHDHKNYWKLAEIYYERCRSIFYAYELYEKALRLKPNDQHLYEYLAWRYFPDPSKKKRALELLEKSYNFNPDSLYTLKNLGRLYLYFKKYGEAERYLKKSFALDEKDEWVALRLAYTYAAQGKQKKAKKWLEISIDMGMDRKDIDLDVFN